MAISMARDQPVIDLCPMLTKSPGVTVKVIDPNGVMYFLPLNHLQPPFDHPGERRALLPVLDRKSFTESVAGDQTEYGKWPTGYFTSTMPMANDAGLEAPTAKRAPVLARRLLAEAGDKGEPVVLMAPNDQADASVNRPVPRAPAANTILSSRRVRPRSSPRVSGNVP